MLSSPASSQFDSYLSDLSFHHEDNVKYIDVTFDKDRKVRLHLQGGFSWVKDESSARQLALKYYTLEKTCAVSQKAFRGMMDAQGHFKSGICINSSGFSLRNDPQGRKIDLMSKDILFSAHALHDQSWYSQCLNWQSFLFQEDKFPNGLSSCEDLCHALPKTLEDLKEKKEKLASQKLSIDLWADLLETDPQDRRLELAFSSYIEVLRSLDEEDLIQSLEDLQKNLQEKPQNLSREQLHKILFLLRNQQVASTLTKLSNENKAKHEKSIQALLGEGWETREFPSMDVCLKHLSNS